jgi:hypothetical protein
LYRDESSLLCNAVIGFINLISQSVLHKSTILIFNLSKQAVRNSLYSINYYSVSSASHAAKAFIQAIIRNKQETDLTVLAGIGITDQIQT